MNGLVVALMIVMAGAASAGDACSLSQEQQSKVKAQVLAAYPGGATTKTGDLRWISSEKLTFFSYGGCEDLGSAAWETTKVDFPLSDEAALAIALQLAERFWKKELIGADSVALAAMREGLDKRTWTIDRSDSVTHFRFDHPGFVELNITHSYENGWETVSVEWQGNF